MSKRLESLDVLRGMDMFMILCAGWSPLIFVCEAFGLPDCWLVRQCHHAALGAGVTIIDFVFPLFLFISGVTYPYSHAKSPSVVKVFRRVAVLFVLGLFYNGVLAFEWESFTPWSVIGRIGIAWGVAALAYHFTGWRGLAWLTAGVSAFWWAWTAYASRCLGGSFIEMPYATVAMTATAALGVLTGEFMRTTRLEGTRRALVLAACGAAAVAAGAVFSAMPSGAPVTKVWWSTPFIFVTAGVSAVLLAVLHWIVDVRGFARWGFFFKIIGVNPLTVYLLSNTVLEWKAEKEFFFGGMMRLYPGPVMNACAEWGTLALYWLMLYWMYRRKIFLKV